MTRAQQIAFLAHQQAIHAKPAQGYNIPFAPQFAVAAPLFTTQLQKSSMLGDVILQADQPGSADISAGGVPLNASNQLMDLAAFNPQAQTAGHRAIGFMLKESLNVQAAVALAAAGRSSGYVGCDPIPDTANVRPVAELGPLISYTFGMGAAVVPFGGIINLQATAERDCFLGLFGLSLDVAAPNLSEVTVEGIFHNAAPMQNAPALTQSGVELYDWQNTDIRGRLMMVRVRQNDRITVNLRNSGGVNATVRGGFFCIHPKGVY